MSFASSVTIDSSLEDLIQGLGDTSWVLVEGWEGGASGRVKSQLPSLGLGHVWGTTYIPSSLWKQAISPSPCLAWYQTQAGLILFHVLLPLSPHWFLWENFILFLFLQQPGATLLWQCTGFSILCFSWNLTGFSGRISFFIYFILFFLIWLHEVFSAAQDFCICSKQGLLCNFSALAFQSRASLDVDHRL